MAILNRRDTLKLLASVGAAGAAAPLLAACGGGSTSASNSNSPVRLAFVVPQTGPLHPIGDEMTAGRDLYLRNSGNVLGGRPLALTTVDEGASTSEGRSAVDKILKGADGGSADVIVGIGNSAVVSAVRDAVDKAQIPLLGTNGAPADLLGSPYVWQVSYVDGNAGSVLGDYLNQAGVHHVYVFDDGGDSSTAEADAFRRIFSGSHQSSSGHVATAISNIRNSAAGAVVAACTGTAAQAFLKAYHSSGISKPLYGPGFLTEGFVVEDKATAMAARNVYTVLNYSPDLDNEANRQFASAYFGAQHGSVPSTYAMAAYDALAVLDRAISLIDGDVTAHAIRSALGSVGQFDSPRGQWQFNQVRTPQQSWYLRQFRPDGRVWENNVLQRLVVPAVRA